MHMIIATDGDLDPDTTADLAARLFEAGELGCDALEFRESPPKQAGVSENHRQLVVEVVCDATRENAEASPTGHRCRAPRRPRPACAAPGRSPGPR